MRAGVDGQESLSLDGALGADFTSMGPDEAARHALRHFGVQGEFQRFATEKDDTYRIETPDQRRYVLKLANPMEDRAELSLQTRLLQHIAQVDPGLPVPRVQCAVDDGADIVTIVDAAGQQRHMHLLSYLEGTPLDYVSSNAGQRVLLGHALARLRLAMAGFSHPSDGRVLAWDVQHLPRLAHLLADVADAQQRRVLEQGFARFCALAPRMAGLRTQVLHNDFNTSNTVVDPAHPDFVTGIIDFGDVVRTAVAIDVSTAVLSQLPRDMATNPDQDMFSAAKDLVRGYLEKTDLLPDERSLLPHLVMGRVIARALITLWRARRMPHNATYVLRNTEQGWGQMNWFLARHPDEVSATFINL